jgi:hypothetical protein
MKNIYKCAIGLLFASLPVWQAFAQEAPEMGGQDRNPWTYSITPYVWMTGLKGTVSIGDFEVPVDESFSDILDDVKLGMMFAAEAHNGKWGVFSDVVYANLENGTETLLGVRTTDIKQSLLTVGGIYRVMDSDQTQMDVGAGIRYTNAKLKISGPLVNTADSDSSIDPILMARLRYRAAEKVSFILTGGIGGFGVDADLLWQLEATVGYNISESMVLMFGYRHFDYKLEDDVTVDIAMRGLALGVSFFF